MEMKLIFKNRHTLYAFLVVMLLLSAPVCYALDKNSSFSEKTLYTWSGPSGENWNSPSNWTPVGVPSAGDEVIILGASVVITDPVTISSLSIDNNTTLTLNNSLTLTGGMFWGNATITGSDTGSLTLSNSSVLNLETTSSHRVGGTITINLNGTTNWISGSIVQSGTTNVTINNNGVFDMQGDFTMGSFNLIWGTFNNFGTFRKSAGSNNGFIEAAMRLNNNGLLEVLSGTLQIRSGSFNTGSEALHTGTFEITTGASLRFIGGNHRFSETVVLTGPQGAAVQGDLHINTNALLNIDGQLDFKGSWFMSGGRLTINQSNEFTNLHASGNSFITLNNELTISDSLTLGQTTINGSDTGILQIPDTVGVTINGSGLILGGNITLNLNGNTTWIAGSITQTGTPNVVINNNGLFDMQGDFTMGSFNLIWGTFNNFGTFRKSAGSNNGFIEAAMRLNNNGLLEVLSGTLQIRSGSFNTGSEALHTGTFEITTGASLRFIGGNHRFSETVVLTGPQGAAVQGDLHINTNALLNIDGLLDFKGSWFMSGGRLTINQSNEFTNLHASGNSFITLNNELTISDSLTLGQTTINGSDTGILQIPDTVGVTINGSGLILGGNITLNLNGNTTWIAGSITQTGTPNVVINNNGLFDMQGDFTMGSFNLIWGTFNNFGTFRKSAGSNNGFIEAAMRLNNNGLLEVLSGTLQIRSGSFNTGSEALHTGTFEITTGASLRFIGGNHRFSETVVLTGPQGAAVQGDLHINTNALLNIDGLLDFKGSWFMSGGRLTINQSNEFTNLHASGNSFITLNNELTISDSLTLGQTTINGSDTGILQIPDTVGVTINGSGLILGGNITLNLNGNTTWIAGSITQTGTPNVVINNNGLFDMQGDFTMGSFNLIWGTFNNFGTFRKSAGSNNGFIEAAMRLNNNGLLEVLSGTLQIRSGSFNTGSEALHTGTFEITTGASLRFIGGNHRFSETVVLTGPQGAAVQGDLHINTNALLNIDGQLDFKGSWFMSGGRLTLNQSNEFTNLHASGNSFITLNNELTISDSLILGQTTINGSDTGILQIPDTVGVTINGSGLILGGNITLNLNGNTTWIAGSITQTGTPNVVINNNGLFDMQGDFTMGSFNLIWGTFNNFGTFRKSAGSNNGWVDAGMRLNNSGTLEVFSGTLIIRSGLFNLGIIQEHSGKFIINQGTTLNFNNGTHSLTENGLITGSGTFTISGGSFSNNGIVEPGNPIDTLFVAGNFPMSSSTAKLAVELGGDQPGITHDQLVVSGAANLNGTVDVSLSTGFTPTPNQQFTILSAGSVTGTFQNITFPDLGPGNGFSAVYEANNVKLQYNGSEITPPTTYTWVGPATGGDWHTAANWTPAGVPGINDEAIIVAGTVVVNDPVVVRNLNISSNMFLNLNNSLTVSGSMLWGFATITGPETGILNIAENAQLVLGAGFTHSVGGTITINLNGTTIWTDGPIGQNQTTNVIINNTGIFEMQGNLSFGTFNAYWGTFNNSGVFRKSAGNGDGIIETGIRLNNTGLIEILSGNLVIRSGLFNPGAETVHGSTIEIGDNSILMFNGSIHRLPEGGVISGPQGAAINGGIHVVSGANLILDAPIDHQGGLLINGATFTINNPYTFPTLVADGNASLLLNDDLTITNIMNMGFGRIQGPATSALTIPAGAQLNIVSSNGLLLGDAIRLNLHGTTHWTSGNISHAGGTDIVINNTGVFEMQGNHVLGSFNAYWGTFNNSGTFRKSAGDGDGYIESGIQLNNTGLIEILSGNLVIRSGLFNPGAETVHGSTIEIGDNSILKLYGAIHRLPEGGVISGPQGAAINGGIHVISNANLILDAPLDHQGELLINSSSFTINKPYTFPTLVADGNSFLFLNDELTITNTMTMGFGRIQGPATSALTIPAGAQLNIVSSNGLLLGEAIRLNLHGTTHWTSGNISHAGGTDIVINNTGVFEMQGNHVLGSFNAYWGTFNNSGTFRKSAGDGDGYIETGIRLNNTGLIEILSGNLIIRSGIFNEGTVTQHTGSILIFDDAELTILGGAHNLAETGIITGNGTLNLTGGTFTNNGTFMPGDPIGLFNVNGAFPMSSSTAKMAVELGGDQPGITHDLLVVSANALLNGSLGISLLPGFFPEPQQEFTVFKAATITGTFENITFPDLGPNNVFVVEYSDTTVIIRFDGEVLSAPIAVDDNVTTEFNTAVIINALENDLSPNGDPLTVISITQPQNGISEITIGNTITYTPGSNFSGEDSFTYTISNSLNETSTASIFVTVNEQVFEPVPPIAVNDVATTPANISVDIDVLDNDSDPQDFAITITDITQPVDGSVQLLQQDDIQIIRYTPDQDFSGEDQFTYTIISTLGLTASAFVFVTVLPATEENQAPVALDDAATTVMELPVVIDVLANDTDPDGDLLSILGFEATGQAGGQIALTIDQKLQYTPNAGFTGTDGFRYSITDGRDGVDTAFVSVEVFPIRFEVILTGAPGTRAMVIDSDGSMAGFRVSNSGAMQAFYHNNSGETFFNTGNSDAQIYAISQGKMAGVVQLNDTTAMAHTFQSDGTSLQIGSLDGNFSLAYGINTSGTLTGVSRDPQGRYRIFAHEDGQGMEDVTPQGFESGTGFSINASGQIAGVVEDVSGVERALIAGTVSQENNSRAYSINNQGAAVGSVLQNSKVEAVLWNSPTQIQVLPAANFTFSEAYSISDAGWIAGTAGPDPFVGSTKSHPARFSRPGLPLLKSTSQSTSFITGQQAVVWISGSFFNLNELIDPSLGWTLLEAAAINSAGQIAGTGMHLGEMKAFVLNPVNEAPPVAKDFAETITKESELLIDLSLMNSGQIKIVHAGLPSNGSVTIEDRNQLKYIPAPGFTGTDHFRYALSNGRSASYGNISIKVEEQTVNLSLEPLSQNYPNPFTLKTTIKIYHVLDGELLLEVYNLMGQKVKTVHSGWLDAGEYTFTIDAAGMGSGTYLYRLTGQSGIQARRMTIVK
jgi:hypothetical protein